jgi:hypothetical protein
VGICRQLRKLARAKRWAIAGVVLALAVAVASTAAAGPARTSAAGKRSVAPFGRYRVVVEGFRVTSETWDNAGQWDGKRDEVFLNSRIAYLGPDGKDLAPESQVESQTMGDRNDHENRVQAGSASDRGGLRSGDTFPNPLTLDAEPSGSSGNLVPPAVLWEGDLIQGKRAVVITPSIWEWDGAGDTVNSWVKWGEEAIPKLAQAIGTFIGGGGGADTIKKASDLAVGVLKVFDNPALFGVPGDRPIGTLKNPNGNDYIFDPLVVLLNYDRAETLISEQTQGVSGLVALHYKDDPALTGDYTLYLRVERVKLKPDTTAPSVNILAPVLMQGHRARVRWQANDLYVEGAETTGVESYDVGVKKSNHWKIVLDHTDSTSYIVHGKHGGQIIYRVRARDGAGKTSHWSQPHSVLLA